MFNHSHQPAPQRRTRSDHANETAEDYVEAIAAVIADTGTCRVADLARWFGVSHVTVTKIVQRLQAEGLVETAPYRPLKLTTKGTRLAAKSRRRHEIVYQFLLALGLDERTAAVDAEGIEHHVSPATLETFAKFLAENPRRT
ncbi:MAG: manganese-binding transcriptional regulator MntR [Pirellulales bacterium]